MKKYHYMTLLVAIVLVAHLKYILSGGPMIFYGDNAQQVLPFYYHGWDLVHSGELNFWDWNHGLGASLFTHSYYFLASPFFWLMTLFPREAIPYLFLYWYILKLSLLAIFSFMWLCRLNKNLTVAFIGALMITFSGWVVTYYHFFFFLDAFLLYPLILYAIERYLTEKKYALMVCMIALLTVTNLYFSYQLIPFAMMYSLFRNFMMNRGKEIIMVQLKVIGFYLLGIGLGGLVLIPSALIIIQTPRFSEGGFSMTSMVSLKEFYRYVTSILVAPGDRYNPNFLINTEIDPGIGWGGGASLYTSMLTPLCLPLILFLKDKREKMGYLIFLGSLAFFFLFKVFYYLFVASLETRWFYMFTFLFVMIVTRFLEGYFTQKEVISYHHKYFKTTVIALSGGIILASWGLYFITLWKNWNPVAHHIRMLREHFIFASIMIVILAVILLYKKIKHPLWIISLLVAVEGGGSLQHLISVDPPLSKSDLAYQEVERSGFFNELQQMDSSFYRVEVNSHKQSDANLPMSSHFKGFRFYSSVYQYSMDQFLTPLKTAGWTISQQIGKEHVQNLLAYKYYVDFEGDGNVPFGFYYLTNLNGYIVYQNRYASELGFMVNQFISESAFNEKTPLEQNLLYPTTLVLPDEFVEENQTETQIMEPLEQIIEYGQPGFFSFVFEEAKEKTMVYVENFGSPNLSVKAYYQDEVVFEQSGFQFDFAGFYIETKFDYLEVIVEDYGDPYPLVNIYLDEALERFDESYSKRSEQSLIIDEFNNDNIKAHIRVKEGGQWLFTSIPYDKGWTVKVNGEVIDVTKVNQGFIGFPLEAGEYELEFSYWPVGLNAGLILSGLSLVILVGFMVKDRRQSK